MKSKKLKFLQGSIMLLMAALLMVSCNKDEGNDPVDLFPNLNGLYVTGTNTIASEVGTPESKMNLAILDPNQGVQVDNMAGVYGKFMHIGANSTLKLTYVENEVGTTFGASGGGSLDSAIVAGGAVNDLVIHGDLQKDGTPIQVSREGLYYLFVNYNEKTFILMEVKANIIGDATELQWSGGTPLPLKSSDVNGTVFEGTEIPLVGASGYRYRFNDGWHVFQGNEIVTLSSLGVPSYAEAWDTGINNIGFHLDNCPHKETGIFTITLEFNAKTGEWKETKTKTGDLLVDYSDAEYGWFGNAYYVSDGVPGAWEAIHHIQKPVRDGNLYNWTWSLELIEGRSFVLRENSDPGAWITWGGAAKLGPAFEENLIIKEDGQDNYFVSVGGKYNITFTINAEDEGRILTIEPEG